MNRSPFAFKIGPTPIVVDVRWASLRQRMMEGPTASVLGHVDEALDLESVIGQPASLEAGSIAVPGAPPVLRWTGLVKSASLERAEPGGLWTYRFELAHEVWLMSQRRDLRIFQYDTEVGMALQVLKEWGIEPELRLDKTAFGARKYRVQSDESDGSFVRRMLEDAGVSLWTVEVEGKTRVVLGERPQATPPRLLPLPFSDDRGEAPLFARDVHIVQRVRPGRYTLRDHDFRRPHDYDLSATAEEGRDAAELGRERYEYDLGSFLFGTTDGEDTAVADSRGKVRTNEKLGNELAGKRLAAKRASGKVVSFETNAIDLKPGDTVHIVGHPRSDLGPERPLLVLEARLVGGVGSPLRARVYAIDATRTYRPPLVTPRPRVRGTQCGQVVAPKGKELLHDEFGRVPVQFHWDRKANRDETASCFVHVSQPWAGMGFGGVQLPRNGHDVIIDFLGGNPDRPIITGRLFTADNPVPYKLPEGKNKSTWRSSSTNGVSGRNEIMIDDTGGSELMAFHAQRDLVTVAKKDMITTVDNSRTHTVGGNDIQVVKGTQEIGVHSGTFRSTAKQANLKVGYAGLQWLSDETLKLRAAEAIYFDGKTTCEAGVEIEVKAEAIIVLKCGPSTVEMTPGKIAIWGPKVVFDQPKK